MALVAVLLLLMTISALGAALAISGTTETLIARNHQNAAEARAAAEAGLSHALSLTLDFVQSWPGGGYASPSLAMTALLADPSLADMDTVAAGVTSLDDLSDIDYEAEVFDDDNEADRDISLDSNDLLRMGENGDDSVDLNSKLVVRAIGYAGGNAVATVEATIAPTDYPAIITDGDLEVDGDVDITAPNDSGGMHANGDIDFNGAAWSSGDGSPAGTTDTGSCSASGTSDDAGCTAGAGAISVPQFEAADYESRADFILFLAGGSTPSMTTVATSTTVACNPCNNWEYSGGSWNVPNGTNTPLAGTYYVEGDIDVDRNITQTLTLIAEGDITLSANATITPAPTAGGLLFVTNQDLLISGQITVLAQGQILVMEQVNIGPSDILGQVIVRETCIATCSTLVTASRIHGDANITYDGNFDDTFFSVSAWRRSY
jgi:hypothetical protein